MITRYSIVTLILFFISIIFVIQPFPFHVNLPILGRKRLTLGLMSASIIAIGILWASQCLGATQIRNGFVGTDNIKPYNILILFISLAYMAITLDTTGILRAAAFWVGNKGGSSGRKLYFYFYVLFTVISMIVGSDPVIFSGTVFLVYYTQATQLDADAWLISEFAAANTASMVLFVGNPTNVVICEGFRINYAAFTAYTILPFLACSVACYLALMIQFRQDKYVPRKLAKTRQLNPRDVLNDPVSAIFGSIWLFTCLVVVIVLSFFHVDVWKVVLPFAGGKFVFDIAWDHYRYTTGKIPKYDPNQNEGPSQEDAMRKYIRAHTIDTVFWGDINQARVTEVLTSKEPESLVINTEKLVQSQTEKLVQPQVERLVQSYHAAITHGGLHRTVSPAKVPSKLRSHTVDKAGGDDAARANSEKEATTSKAKDEAKPLTTDNTLLRANSTNSASRGNTDATLVAGAITFKEPESIDADPEKLVQSHHGAITDGGLRRTDSPSYSSTESSDTAAGHPPAAFILKFQARVHELNRRLSAHWPTFFGALPRLPFGPIPFAFAQFILIEALEHQGWVQVFSRWLVIASNGQLIPIVWIVGIFGVILCNIFGTSIGATILLTKIVRASQFSQPANIAAAVSLAIASNIGAVNFTFSASLTGLLWESILADKGYKFRQRKFAKFNMLPLLVMTAVGLSVATVMMVVLY